MKKYINLKLLVAIFATLLVISCSDDESGPAADVPGEIVPTLASGALISFQDGAEAAPTIDFSTPSEAGFSITVVDPVGNVVSYSLDLTATVNGEIFTAENAYSTTSFPATFDITVPDMVELLGLNIDDVNFGDNFAFVATATNEDGFEGVGQLPTFDTDTLEIGEGNTINELLTSAGFNAAMNFNLTLACPAFDLELLAGTYTVDFENLGGALGLTDPDPTREIVLGPGDGQITIIGGSIGYAGGDDLIVDVDVTTGVLSVGRDADGNTGLAFPEGTAGLGFGSDYGDFAPGGLVLTCLDVITLDVRVTLTCCGGTFGMGLTRQ